MNHLFVLVGLPGAGKSTFAEGTGLKIVATDAIRKRMGIELGDMSANTQVFETFYASIEAWIYRESVVADSTALYRTTRHKLLHRARQSGASAHVVLFDNVNLALERNRMRETLVTDELIMRMVPRLKESILDISSEGFDNVWRDPSEATRFIEALK